MAFWNKKHNETLNSAEFESCTKKIIELNAKFEELSVKYKMLETNYDNLRGMFNRKLNKLKKEDIEEEVTEEKDINNPVILPDNGRFTFGR